MRVLAACSLGGAGHLQPLVPLLDSARRRGDETLVVGPPALAELVAATGHPFAAGGEPAEEDVAPIREQLPTAPPEVAAVLGNRELFGRLATAAMLPAMRETFASWRPDLVLREPCEYASAVVAAERGVPTAQVAISLAEAEEASITHAAPALEDHRRGLVAELRRSPYLTRMPAALDPSPFATTVRFREAPASSPEPLPDWWGGRTGPLVYLTLGTVLGYMSIAQDAYRTVLAAVDRLEARVLLTVGRRFDRNLLGSVPANVHVEPWVDQARVLAVCDLVVCHGGSGTTFGALAAGVPLVVVPHFADQFENGRRVAAAGAGLTVEAAPAEPGATGDGPGGRRPPTPADAARIAGAAQLVLGRDDDRRAARRIAAEMAATPTADEILDQLLLDPPATPDILGGGGH